MAQTFIEASRSSWNASSTGATMEQINAGSLQRIAAATELMARRYEDLIFERDRYKHRYDDSRKVCAALEKRNAALKGVITKLKKELA